LYNGDKVTEMFVVARRHRAYVFSSGVLQGWLKPNSITLASYSSELAPNMFGASSKTASVVEFGREPASSC